jgi:hypothetical protein
MDAKDKLQQIKYQRSKKDILIDLTRQFGFHTDLVFRKEKLGDYYDYFYVENKDLDIEVITSEFDSEGDYVDPDELIASRISMFMKDGKLYLILYCCNTLEWIEDLKRRMEVVEKAGAFKFYDIHMYHFEDSDQFLCRLHHDNK